MVDLVDRYSLVLHALIFLLLPQYMTSLYNLFSGSTTLRSNFTSQKRYMFFYLVQIISSTIFQLDSSSLLHRQFVLPIYSIKYLIFVDRKNLHD